MKIAVTRLEEKAEGTKELFAGYGHEAVLAPTMKTAPVDDTASLDELCSRVRKGEVDVLIISSTMGVKYFFERCTSIPGNTSIVTVGPKTADAVKNMGFACETIPSFSSDNFASYLGDRIRDRTVGIVRPDITNTKLVESLMQLGGRVMECIAYRLLPTGNDFLRALQDADAVIFTSGKSFTYAAVSAHDLDGKTVIAIGPKTADTMHRGGVTPDITGNGTLEDCLRELAGQSM